MVKIAGGDGDVVGDRHRVEDFPDGVVIMRPPVLGARCSRTDGSSTEGVASDEDVRPLEADIPGVDVVVVIASGPSKEEKPVLMEGIRFQHQQASKQQQRCSPGGQQPM